MEQIDPQRKPMDIISPNLNSYYHVFVLGDVGISYYFLVAQTIKKSISNNAQKYKIQKGIEAIRYIFIAFTSISYFTGNIKDFDLAIGLLTAGIPNIC